MAFRVLLAEIMDIVCRNEGKAQLLGQPDELGVNDLLGREAVILKLEIEVPFAEERAIFSGGPFRGVIVFPFEVVGDFSFEATGKPDQSLRMRLQELLIDPGPIIETFQVGLAQQLTEVAVPRLILDQQEKMKMMGIAAVPRLIKPAAGRHINLTTQDRLDIARSGLFKKSHRPENIAVVGQGHGRHLVLVSRLHQSGGLGGTVQYAVLRVIVEVDERVFHFLIKDAHSHSIVAGGFVVTS